MTTTPTLTHIFSTARKYATVGAGAGVALDIALNTYFALAQTGLASPMLNIAVVGVGASTGALIGGIKGIMTSDNSQEAPKAP